MSDPTRYTQNIKCVEPSYLAQNIQSGTVECSIGEWVLHSDYARLKAEVERLTKLCQATSPDGFIHIRDIKEHPLMGPAWEARQRDAKEGKQP